MWGKVYLVDWTINLYLLLFDVLDYFLLAFKHYLGHQAVLSQLEREIVAHSLIIIAHLYEYVCICIIF